MIALTAEKNALRLRAQYTYTEDIYSLATLLTESRRDTVRSVRAAEQRPAFRVLAAANALRHAWLNLGPAALVEGNTQRLRTRRRRALVRRLRTVRSCQPSTCLHAVDETE